MAEEFQFKFTMDWSDAQRSTKQFIEQVRAEFSTLQAEADRIIAGNGGKEPKQGTALGNQYQAVQSKLAIPAAVIGRNEELIASAQMERAQLANAAVAAEAAAARRIRLKTEEALTEKLLAADAEYIEATRQLAVNQRLRLVKERIAEQETFLSARAPIPAGATKGNGAALEAANASQVLKLEAQAKVNDEILKAQQEVRTNAVIAGGEGGLKGYAETLAKGKVAEETRTSAVEAATNVERAGNEVYLKSQADAALALRERKAAEEKATNAALIANPGLGLTEAANAVTRNSLAAQRATVEAELLTGSEVDLDIQAKRIVAEKELQTAINSRVKVELAARAASGEISAGTGFQRFQAGVAARQGGAPRLPTEFQTLGQFVQSKLVTTAGFAVSGAAFFGLIQGVRSVFTETSKLQTELALVKVQLEEVGRGNEFDSLKDSILGISRETGIAADEIAHLALQLRGAFADKDIGFVTKQLEAAGKISRVTGLSSAEITDSLTGISKTFGISFEKIGDTALGLQQRFGVLSKEIITFAADLGPVAEQAGLSFEKLSAIGAAVQQVSGRSGSGLAESLGRVFSGLQDNAAIILSIYQDNAKLSNRQDAIATDLAHGKTGKVLEDLIKNYDKLTRAQQNLLNSALGGSRQAPVLAALFNSNPIQKELDRINNGGTDAGKLNQQFKELQGTVGQAFAQFKQTLTQLGIALAETVLPAFKDLISLITSLAGILGPVARFVGTVANAFGGLGVKILEAVVALKALRLLGGLTSFGGGGAGAVEGAATGGLFSRLLGTRGTPEIPAPPSGTSAGVAAVAGTGLRGLLSGTAATSTYVTLGVAASTALILGLSNGYNKGVEQAIAKAKTDAQKNALTAKGLRLAQSGAGGTNFTFTSDIHGLGEAAQNVKNAFTGQASKQELVEDEYQKAVGAAYVAQIKAVSNLKSFKNPKELLKKLGDKQGVIASSDGLTNKNLDAVDPTDDTSFAELKRIHDELVKKYGKDYLGGVIKAFKRQTQKKATERAINSGDLQGSEQFKSDSKADYDAGLSTGPDYVASLLKVLKADFKIVQSGAAPKNTVKELLKTEADLANFESNRVKDDLSTLRSLRQARGQDIGPQDIQEVAQALASGKVQDPSVAQDLLNQAYQDYQTLLRHEIDNLQTAAEKSARAKQGIDVDPRLKIAQASVSLRNAIRNQSSFSIKFFNQIALQRGDDPSTLYNEMGRAIVEDGLSAKAALLRILRAALADDRQTIAGLRYVAALAGAKSKALKAAIKSAKEQIAADKTAIDNVKNTPFDIPDPVDNVTIPDTFAGDAAKEADDAAQKAAEAQAALLKAQAGKDPVAQAKADLYAAQVAAQYAKTEADQINAVAQRVTAEQELADANHDIAQAQGDLLKAWVARNPVLVAQVELAQAKEAVATAEGDAAKLRAMAQEAAAQRALQETTNDIVNSWSTFIIALANAAGDSVGAASLSVKDIINKINQAKALGAGPAELNQLQAQLVTAQASLRDAQLQEQESTIDFNLQTEKISTAQAIAQYQALLNNATVLGLTEAQTRDLILKIQNLKHSLSQDLQFDLPTDLALPTLYEARRLNQSGGNYQDNRTVTITLNSTDPASTEAAVAQINDAINAPSVYGSGSRIY